MVLFLMLFQSFERLVTQVALAASMTTDSEHRHSALLSHNRLTDSKLLLDLELFFSSALRDLVPDSKFYRLSFSHNLNFKTNNLAQIIQSIDSQDHRFENEFQGYRLRLQQSRSNKLEFATN